MLFCTELAIPANTPRSRPAVAKLQLTRGVVRHVWVRWRFGSGNLCGCVVRWHRFQIWPLTGSSWIPSSSLDLSFDEDFTLVREPYEVEIEGYNTDEIYSHKVWVGLNVFPIEETAVEFVTGALRARQSAKRTGLAGLIQRLGGA